PRRSSDLMNVEALADPRLLFIQDKVGHGSGAKLGWLPIRKEPFVGRRSPGGIGIDPGRVGTIVAGAGFDHRDASLPRIQRPEESLFATGARQVPTALAFGPGEI